MSLEKIPDVLRALADERVDYVLIGAVAMMAAAPLRHLPPPAAQPCTARVRGVNYCRRRAAPAMKTPPRPRAAAACSG